MAKADNKASKTPVRRSSELEVHLEALVLSSHRSMPSVKPNNIHRLAMQRPWMLKPADIQRQTLYLVSRDMFSLSNLTKLVSQGMGRWEAPKAHTLTDSRTTIIARTTRLRPI
jgi:hypothetical protein